MDASFVRERGPDVRGWSCVTEGEVREGQRWARLKREEGLEAQVMAFGPMDQVQLGYAGGVVCALPPQAVACCFLADGGVLEPEGQVEPNSVSRGEEDVTEKVNLARYVCPLFQRWRCAPS